MKTLILKEPGSWEVGETNIDGNLEDDQVLLKVHRIGVCGTDLHAFRGKQPFFSYPRILGHELGLEVVEIGRQVSRVKIGDKCALEPYFNFKEDQAVKLGKTNCGEFISVFGVHQDGGMQEFIKVSAKYLHKSSKLTYDQLALIEPLGIGCHAVSRANINSEDKVLVIGAGPIGLATMQFATIKHAKVVALDINEDRLRFCMQNLDLVGTVNAKSTDVIEQLRNLFDGDLPTVVMDATGNEHSMKNTLDYVAFGGKIVFIGLYQGDFTFFDPLFHKKEITLLASRNALGADFEEIISLMEEGKVATDHWITHRVPFDDLPKRFESLLNPESGVIKAMVEL